MKRGDIMYVHCDPKRSTGSEQTYSRPGVIVSCDNINRRSPVVEVVFLTTKQRRRACPTQVIIKSIKRTSVARCEEVYSVDKSRLERTIGRLTKAEQRMVDKALMVSLGIKPREEISNVSGQ